MMKTFLGSLKDLRFVLLVAVQIWIKTYLVQALVFDLEIEGITQQILLFISPLAASLFFVGISLFFSGKRRNVALVVINLLLTIILVGNVLFYGFYDDFITLPIFLQGDNLFNLGSSIRALITPFTIMLFADIFVMKKFPNFANTKKVSALSKGLYFMLTAAIFMLNLSLAQAVRPQLLTRSFDREMLVGYMGLYFFQGYDAFLSVRTSTQRAMANSGQLQEVENFIRSNHVRTDSHLFGAAEGKNVIMISLESLQTFVMGQEVNGEPITPFLDELIERSYFFDNFYHQTAQGKTADSELLINTSLYPLGRGAVFFTHPTNEFITIPELLSMEGYYTSVIHSNGASFWNRNVMYSSLGYDTYYSVTAFDVNEENTIGWGLSDVSFFEQSIAHLEAMPEPFYARMITLTNHFPYEIDEERMMIDPFNSGDRTFDRYVQTVRYMDEALRVFFDELKASGLYDNSIIVMYGDHYGQSENRQRPVAQFLGKEEITDADQVQLQRVPFIVHFPNQQHGEVISTISGQIDVKPTLMSLLGIETSSSTAFGTDMFASEHPNKVIFREGSFVNEDYIYRNGQFFDRETREEIEPPANQDSLLNRVAQELYYSDRIILGDLLQFYNGRNIPTGTITTEIR